MIKEPLERGIKDTEKRRKLWPKSESIQKRQDQGQEGAGLEEKGGKRSGWV